MLICMKPSDKQIHRLREDISSALAQQQLSLADIARTTGVHASQVSRICAGEFRTFSNNVVQICNALSVKVPRFEEADETNTEWVKVQASLRRIWDETPEGAATIRRMLDAIADLRVPSARGPRRDPP